MAISPFPARPGSPETEGRRARLVILLAVLGIAASLLAYAVSPSVRHAVGHAAHSVRHAVGNVFDHDRAAHRAPAVHARPHARVVLHAPVPARTSHARTSHTRTSPSHGAAHATGARG